MEDITASQGDIDSVVAAIEDRVKFYQLDSGPYGIFLSTSHEPQENRYTTANGIFPANAIFGVPAQLIEPFVHFHDVGRGFGWNDLIIDALPSSSGGIRTPDVRMSVPPDDALKRSVIARALSNYAINAAIADLNAQIRIHSGVATREVALSGDAH